MLSGWTIIAELQQLIVVRLVGDFVLFYPEYN